MGWTWALWWCQRIHEEIMERAGALDCDKLVDRRPAPPVRPGGSVHTAYVDNFIALGTDVVRVRENVDGVMVALQQAGLLVEREKLYVDDPDEAQVLGWAIRRSPAMIRPTTLRLWKVRLAIRAILARGRISGRDLEHLA